MLWAAPSRWHHTWGFILSSSGDLIVVARCKQGEEAVDGCRPLFLGKEAIYNNRPLLAILFELLITDVHAYKIKRPTASGTTQLLRQRESREARRSSLRRAI